MTKERISELRACAHELQSGGTIDECLDAIESLERELLEARRSKDTLRLRVDEIHDLAMFCGFKFTNDPVGDEAETEIAVMPCPPEGVKNEDDDSVIHYRLIAYYDEYPEEGVCGLGAAMTPTPPTDMKEGGVK